MKKILLISLLTISIINAKISNPEYQKMLATRANILGLPKLQSTQETSQPISVLIKKEDTLNNQFIDLSQQLKNLDSSK